MWTWFVFMITLTISYGKKPHIVIILGDDIGWNDFGFHGSSQIPTPNMDALVYNGAILNRFYTQQTCTPSRTALLTGKYPLRLGMQGWPIAAGQNKALPLSVRTMPEFLKKLGYKNHLVGKWHLGRSKTVYTPLKRGFDSFFGYLEGYCGYYDYKISQKNYTGFDLRDGLKPATSYIGQYATDVFTDKALKIIASHKKTEPLFLYLSHLAAHTGLNGTELELPNLEENDKNFHYIKNEHRRRYAEVVQRFDASVGKVVKMLADQKMLDNTIIVALSDNGAQTNGLYFNSGSNWPLRGEKFTLYEGAVRGSAVVYSQLLRKKGKINNNLIHISDLLPTLYSAAGGDVRDLGDIDGVDQWQSLRDNTVGKRGEIIVNVDDDEGNSAIISHRGRFKLHNGTFQGGRYDGYFGDSGRSDGVPLYSMREVLGSDANKAISTITPLRKQLTEKDILKLRTSLDLGNKCTSHEGQVNATNCQGFCLYDLFDDPCEERDLSGKYPDVVEDLKRKMARFWREVVPGAPRHLDPNSNPELCHGNWFSWLDDVKPSECY